MTRSTISPSPISISFTLLFITLACATSINEAENIQPKISHGFTIPSHVEEQGEDAIKEYLDSLVSEALFGTFSTETTQNKEEENDEGFKEPMHKLNIPSHIEDEGPEAIKEYLDNLLSKAFGSSLTETGQNLEAHTDTNSIELDTNTQIKQEGEKNMDADKSGYKVSKLPREEQLLDDDDIAVNVDLEIVGDGEYVLKIKRVNRSSKNEDEVEKAKNLAQNGAMLLHYGEILQDMGEKLIAQSQASLYSVFKMPASPKLKSDQ